MTDIAGFSALLDKKSELEKQIKAEAKEVFAAASKDVFDKHEDKVGKFQWAQYTPYFNDGEPCTFHKGELWIFTPKDTANEDLDCYIEGSDEFSPYGNKDKLHKTLYRRKSDGYETAGKYIDKERLERDYEAFENPNYEPEWGDAYSAITDLYKLIDDDTALSLFGDHVEVIVTKNGVEVEEYEHE